MSTRSTSPINPHLGKIVLSRHVVKRCAERAELFDPAEPRAWGLRRAQAMLKRIIEKARPVATMIQAGDRNNVVRLGGEPDQYLGFDKFVIAVSRHPDCPRLWKAKTCYFVEAVTFQL